MRPGTRFRSGATRPAGHIFYIPASERPTDDPKGRPHYLVNRCDPGADPFAVATLAHMSTKATEHTEYGSPVHEIETHGSLNKPNQAGSYVIAARLLPRNPERLVVSAMSAVNAVRSVRQSVLLAVGLGEGIATAGRSSVRGRLVRVLDPGVDARYGCVLTGHAYSASRRYQVIVPIMDRIVAGIDGPEILEPTRWDVVPTREPWWDVLPLHSPMLDTAGLISLSEPWRQIRDRRKWLKPQIEILPVSIDDATLATVEARIVERLQQ